MCVAVYKPIGAKLPTREELRNCFERNDDGAGFAFFKDGLIHIKKGYMNFEDFYKAFCEQNFKVDENVFIHFRIATHGLHDAGNTHPFPFTNNFDIMRETELVYKGKCLIHNGVFHYDNKIMNQFPSFISDTMIFSKFLFDEIVGDSYCTNSIKTLEYMVARSLKDINYKESMKNTIDKYLGWSKVAIMNEDGTVQMFGTWNLHNGVYYSNCSYEGFGNYNFGKIGWNHCCHSDSTNYRNNDFYQKLWGSGKTKAYKTNNGHYCDYCGNYSTKCYLYCNYYICEECIQDYNLVKCEKCKFLFNKKDMAFDNCCNFCYEDLKDVDEQNDNEYNHGVDYDICICCGQNYNLKTEESSEKNVCKKCYEKYCLN